MTNLNTETMTIEELRAMRDSLVQKNKDSIDTQVQIALLKGQIANETNEAVIQERVRAEATRRETEKLETLVGTCEGIVASVPVYNRKTHENRTWEGRKRYVYGTQVDLMYALMTGILYSCQEHKQLLLTSTGLNMQIIEDGINAFGSPEYYNRNYNTIVEAKPYDVERAKAVIGMMQSELDVVIDTSKLTEKNFEAEFLNASIAAQDNYNQAQAAIAEADFTL